MGIRKDKILNKTIKHDRQFIWFPIFFTGIKNIFRKRFSKLLFSFCAIPTLVFLAILYISARPQLQEIVRQISYLETDASFFYTFFTNNFILFILLIISVFAGADLISRDLKFNAIPLYFSRPLKRVDYVLGKISIVMFYLLLFTFVPGLVLVVFKFIFTGKIISPGLLLATLIFPVIVALLFSLISLGISSLSSNTRFTKISIFIVYFLSDLVYGIIDEIFNSKYIGLISIRLNIKNFGQAMFGQKSNFGISGWLSGALILLVIGLLYLYVNKRITKMEAGI